MVTDAAHSRRDRLVKDSDFARIIRYLETIIMESLHQSAEVTLALRG